MAKPILCLDFDGVIHSYTSGWQGVTVIPDPPVEGALAFIDEAIEHFSVYIYSSRSSEYNGIKAMRTWLRKHAEAHFGPDITRLNDFLAEVHFPQSKPLAFVTIDDRALTFTGEWPTIEKLKAFKPWNKGGGDQLKRCTHCGFVIDTTFKAEFPEPSAS